MLAVIIIPPSAFSIVTATATVGVVESSKLITLTPIPTKVWFTSEWIIGPEIRASLPVTTVNVPLFSSN